jgi:putative transposase
MLPDVAVHVIQRGNNRVVCFPEEADFGFYLMHLRRLSAIHGCAVHAYCLMPNHVHLLLTPENAGSCARLMQRLGQLHAQHVNLKYKRTGTLWEGRFKSCLVQSQSYVLACYRYIELNPVRAGLVASPTEYRWSSVMSNAAGVPDPMLSPHAEYRALGTTQAMRLRQYSELLKSAPFAEEVEKIRFATRGGFALGGNAFQQLLATQLGRRVGPGQNGRPKEGASEDQQLALKL